LVTCEIENKYLSKSYFQPFCPSETIHLKTQILKTETFEDDKVSNPISNTKGYENEFYLLGKIWKKEAAQGFQFEIYLKH